MHFLIPVIVFVTANIWGLYSSIPFTNIDPARSIWNRAIGGVQLASTVYTLDQLPRLLDEQAITHQLIQGYLGGWNATLVSETESAMTLSAGHRPLTAPLTVTDGLFPPLPSSTETPFDLRETETETSAPQPTPVDAFAQVLVTVIFALAIWIVLKQNDHTRQLTSALEEIGKVQKYQEAAWNGLVENHDTLTYLVSVANDLRTAPVYNRPVEEVVDAEGSATSSDASSAVVIQSLQDVLASLDTLRQTIYRSTGVWEGLSERLEVFQSGSQDTQPTETSGDDPIGASSGGLAQDG